MQCDRMSKSLEGKMESEKKLYLSSTNKKIGGVCGGIAEYLGIDPTIIRILWVIFAFAVGSGILAYIIAWMLMSNKPPDY